MRTATTAFAIVLVCLTAAVPLLRSDSPCTHDGGLHYYRVVALRQAVSDGIPFTRYLPDLAFGYGYPFFNYREPLPYFVTLGLYSAGVGLPFALNLVYVLCFVAGAFGAYLLAQDLFGPSAGIVAAVAYAYAPYQFLDSLLRGNSPESVALALTPFILWAFRRLALTGRRRYLVLGTGSLAALYLTHYISSLILTPVLLAYMAVLWAVHRRSGHWTAVCGALTIALGLTAMFWGPALLEQGYVQLHMSRVTRNNDFHYNYLRLAELLAPPAAVDTSLVNPPMEVHLGLVQTVVGVVGLVIGLVRWRDGERRATLVFLALFAIGCLWMSTSASEWAWERLPLLAFVQFPWRFVGRAALPVALLASAGFGPVCPGTPHVGRLRSYAALAVAVSALVLAAVPTTYAPYGYCPADPHPQVTDIFSYERRTGMVGVDPEGSYFPVWVKERPDGSPLEAQYAAGATIARFDLAVLPSGASVTSAKYGPNRADLVIDSPTPFLAQYQVFYFPGWEVVIDGAQAATQPSEPGGLLTFTVPSGRHTVTVRFRETPMRVAADIVSAISLVLLVGVVLRYPGREGALSHQDSQAFGPAGTSDAVPLAASAIVLSVALASAGLRLSLGDGFESVFRQPQLGPDGHLLAAMAHVDHSFADGLRLIGYDVSGERIPADDVLRVDLYWTTYSPSATHFQSVLHLVGPDGLRWSAADTFRPRGYADYLSPRTWSPEQYAIDSHEIEPLPGAPPGSYDLVLTVFDRKSLAPISLLNDAKEPAAPTLTIGQVTLDRPRRPLALDQIPGDRLDESLDAVTLLSASLDRTEMDSGDAALLTTYWRAERQTKQDLESSVTVASPGEQPIAQYSFPLAAEWYPVSDWVAGDVWRGQCVLRIPASTTTGDYQLWLGVSGREERVVLPVSLRVSAPPRDFTRPRVVHTLNAPLADFAVLVGFEVSEAEVRAGETFAVTLVWQALSSPDQSYHVFVHLLSEEGRLIAQSDGIPGNWTRPTTGWLAGEYIRETRAIDLPGDARPGVYEVRTGLYLPGDGRIVSPEGEDHISLGSITVEDG